MNKHVFEGELSGLDIHRLLIGYRIIKVKFNRRYTIVYAMEVKA
jgi:hypothetical protein